MSIESLNYLKQALAMANRGVPVVFFERGQRSAAGVGWQNLATTDAAKIIAMAESHPDWTELRLRWQGG